MKKFLFLLTVIFFAGCKSFPDENFVQEQLENCNSTDFSAEEQKSLLKFYFPTFQDDFGNVIDGDCTVVVFPDNSTMVIDGLSKTAENQLVEYLQALGISKIDYLVASHFHEDHIGSFPMLIDSFEVRNIYTNGGYIDTKASSAFVEKMEHSDLHENILEEGDELNVCGCNIKVFSPILSDQDKYNLFYNPGRTAKLINDSSLVFKLTYGNFSILFTGDLYKNKSLALVQKYQKDLAATILKVPHHGDYYTTNVPAFISEVNPECAVILDCRYVKRQFGGRVVVRRYKKLNVPLIFCEEEGEIKILTDGEKYQILLNKKSEL